MADLSLGMLKQAKNKNGLLCACTASEQIPFEDGVFERVIMVDAFHHVQDQARTAMELYRVLKPGGILVVIEPDIRRWAVKLIALMEKMLTHAQPFSPRGTHFQPVSNAERGNAH